VILRDDRHAGKTGREEADMPGKQEAFEVNDGWRKLAQAVQQARHAGAPDRPSAWKLEHRPVVPDEVAGHAVDYVGTIFPARLEHRHPHACPVRGSRIATKIPPRV
jgi:hypothetical protein